jgi:hypothetical protein
MMGLSSVIRHSQLNFTTTAARTNIYMKQTIINHMIRKIQVANHIGKISTGTLSGSTAQAAQIMN